MKRSSIIIIFALLIVAFFCHDTYALSLSRGMTPPKLIQGVGVFGSYNMPGSEIDTKYDSASSFGLKLDLYYINVGMFEISYKDVDFNRKKKNDLSMDCINLNMVLSPFLWTIRSAKPYISVGTGMYMPDRGSSRPGLNAGAGMLLPIKKYKRGSILLGLTGYYHHVIDSELDFYELRTGINYWFD